MSIDQQLQELMFYLRKAVVLSDRVGDRLFRQVAGITKIQYILLLTLTETKSTNTTQQEIARALSITKGAVSRQVFLAQEAGLLTILPSPESRRENRLSITVKGKTALKKAQMVNQELSNARPGTISDHDLSITVQTLKKFCEVLGELETDIPHRK